jgi:hypothetical protein
MLSCGVVEALVCQNYATSNQGSTRHVDHAQPRTGRVHLNDENESPQVDHYLFITESYNIIYMFFNMSKCHVQTRSWVGPLDGLARLARHFTVL